MSILDGIGLHFDETLSGSIGIGGSHDELVEQEEAAQTGDLRFDVTVAIEDLSAFLALSQHEAKLTGMVSCDALGGAFPVEDGRFNLFSLDHDSGERRVVYDFDFTAGDGQRYHYHGEKRIVDDPGEVDLLDDMTRLHSELFRGKEEVPCGSGVLSFDLTDAPSLVSSMRVVGAKDVWQKLAALAAFTSFAYGALRDEYLKDERLMYDTRYVNLVLSGQVHLDGELRPFFLVSGLHDKGFPWGDSENFWDVLLLVGMAKGGYRRFAMTDRVLPGLHLDLEQGQYRYEGPIFEITEGFSTSFHEMRQRRGSLQHYRAEFTIDFGAPAQSAVRLPFSAKRQWGLRGSLTKDLRELFPSAQPLGCTIVPHSVAVDQGRLMLSPTNGGVELRLTVDSSSTFGEAEQSTIRNFKSPTLLHGYICALRPDQRQARVQIHTDTLRDEREQWAKDRVEAFLGTLLSRHNSTEYVLAGGGCQIRSLERHEVPSQAPDLLRPLGEPLLEVNNNHFPTAVFQRRIIQVADPSGSTCWALEESSSLLRREAINTDREVPVAAVRHQDKFQALDDVLERTDFDELLRAKLAESGKESGEFRIAIKPNFMFSYSKHDRSSFTDPDLVAHLVARLRARGFTNIALVEAQSTYGEYFHHRSVREVAHYLGYAEAAGYRIVDLTEEASGREYFGSALGHHPVPPTWRDADFRLSFAKNKTHAYAFFTLSLKNVYGALPLADKFKEYHCERDIYRTTIEYLKRYPVDFGLIDAYESADGPFGVFADTRPNVTETVIGGPDLVAVDWVGATKMGIDPMISQYVRLAVEAWGKPRIAFSGDASIYRPWLNVPVALTLFTTKGLDADYHWGNVFYAAAAQMDETQFPAKRQSWWIRLLRRFTKPLRRAVFVRTGERPTGANRALSWLLYRLGF
jgi:uncharacterized protein (DUF362 family)